MSKKVGIICILFCVSVTLSTFHITRATAAEPQASGGKYYVQVPHVVLPETIEYKPYTDHRSWPYHDGGVGASRSPATYTAFPSYSVPENTEFRTINQLYYPVTPVSQAGASSETVAQVCADNQIVPTDRQIARNRDSETRQPQASNPQPSGAFADLTNAPKFETPSMDSVARQPQNEVEPVYLTKLDGKSDETKNPIRLVSDNAKGRPVEENATPTDSIPFLKSQRLEASRDTFNADISPLRLNASFAAPSDDPIDMDFDFEENLLASRHLNWLNRESLFVRPVNYTEVAPPTQLGFMQPGAGFQAAQTAPAYGQLCQQNYAYGQQPAAQNRFIGAYASLPPQAKYTAATGLNSAWNAYFSAAATQQPMSAQPSQYNSLAQLGGMMPVMSGQPAQQMPGYGMAMQPQMQPGMGMPGYGGGMQQQTIGYILLYPQAAQSGVNMQMAGQQGQGNGDANANGETPAEGDAAADPNAQNQNAMTMQATFVPAQQMQMSNPMMGGMNPYMMNPMMGGMNPGMMNPMMGGMNPYMMNPMMGGMNPYMMNPMMGGMNPYMMNPMMGGMNPYMMNPMMMGMGGMGGMMPPIIIQMPADSGARRGGGFFARRRAAREESQNRYQQASGSLASLFSQPEQMPAKAAYPYGYFGVTASPYQPGCFGGYHDMSMQSVRYPGM